MTMLDRMRRHKAWLKWSLVLVCFAFVFFYIPDFLSDNNAAAPNDVVAQVDGRDITAEAFSRTYQNQIAAYRAAYGGNIDENMLRQLGVEQQILQRMIDEQAALAEAERLNITATDAEVREYLLSMPAFQENGQFIGETRYRQLLRMQQPPVSPEDFERTVRDSIAIQKLQDSITQWVSVSNEEVTREFHQRNEKIRISLVPFSPAVFRHEIKVTNTELTTYFEDNKEDFRIPERRKVRFLLIDTESQHENVTVSEEELQNTYDNQFEQYSTPEQVHARHILLSTNGENEKEIRDKAEKLLTEVKLGANFAELARTHSDDEGSATNGGDLNYFSRGQMVPEFEEVAFSLEVGAISELVKTQFGFHIILVEDKREAGTRPLDEVRSQILEQLIQQKSQTLATSIGEAISSELAGGGTLDSVAEARALTVQQSDFFDASEQIVGLGFSSDASRVAFTLADKEISAEAVTTTQGPAFLELFEKKDAYLPELEEVREKANSTLVSERSVELARARATELAPQFKENFSSAAIAAGLEILSTDELVARGSRLPGIGVNEEIDEVAFALPTGGVSDPIEINDMMTIVHVTERDDVTSEEVEAGRDELRSEMLETERIQFFSAYMVKAKQRLRIEINPNTFDQLSGII